MLKTGDKLLVTELCIKAAHCGASDMKPGDVYTTIIDNSPMCGSLGAYCKCGAPESLSYWQRKVSDGYFTVQPAVHPTFTIRTRVPT